MKELNTINLKETIARLRNNLEEKQNNKFHELIYASSALELIKIFINNNVKAAEILMEHGKLSHKQIMDTQIFAVRGFLDKVDKNTIPTVDYFKSALDQIYLDRLKDSTPIDENKLKILDYHIELAAAYGIRDIINLEQELLKKITLKKEFSKEEQDNLQELQAIKQSFADSMGLSKITIFKDYSKQQDIDIYLKELIDLNNAMIAITKKTVGHHIKNLQPRSDFKYMGEAGSGSHDVLKASSTDIHDYGDIAFIKKINQYNVDNLEILLERAADLITKQAFPMSIAQVKSYGMPKNTPESKMKDFEGIRSKAVDGISFNEYIKSRPALSKIENFEEFVSKNIILLDPDGHTGNAFIHENNLKKIDNGRMGWLNFKNFDEIERFIHDRFQSKFIKYLDLNTNKPTESYNSWSDVTLDKKKMILAMIKDLGRIDLDIVRNSLQYVANQIAPDNIYGAEMPDIHSMHDYMLSCWSDKYTINIKSPKEFVELFSQRFETQHELLRAYVIHKAIDLNIEIEGIKPLDFIQKPKNELFLQAYNKHLLASKTKPLQTGQQNNITFDMALQEDIKKISGLKNIEPDKGNTISMREEVSKDPKSNITR
jgi:hypothetical protein